MHLFVRWKNKIKYPGLMIAENVNLDIQGEVIYGTSCSIEAGSNVIVPARATLTLGDNCYIGRYVELGPGNNICLGSHTSVQDRCILLGDIKIGRYCLMACNVYMSSGRHYFDLQPHALIKDQDDYVRQNTGLASSDNRPVIVEDDCWLGTNVVVMSGVTVGKGAVVGANSVVTKNVGPYTVVAGAPAKVIKKRLNFNPPQSIEFNNPNHLPYFYSGFEVSQAARDKYSVYGGIAAVGECELSLSATSGKSLHLVVKRISQQSCVLTYGSQQKKITEQFQELEFDYDGDSEKTSRFRMRPNIGSVVLIIKKAWIQ